MWFAHTGHMTTTATVADRYGAASALHARLTREMNDAVGDDDTALELTESERKSFHTWVTKLDPERAATVYMIIKCHTEENGIPYEGTQTKAGVRFKYENIPADLLRALFLLLGEFVHTRE